MKQDILCLREVFRACDENSDGYLTLGELRAEFRRQARLAYSKDDQLKASRVQRRHAESHAELSDNLARSLFREVDGDGDGRITFREALVFIYPAASCAQIDACVRYAWPD